MDQPMNPRHVLQVLLAVALSASVRGYAAPVNLSGTIYDNDTKPMPGVVVSLALGGLKDTTGADGKWSLVGGGTSQLAPKTAQPLAKWTGSQLHLDLAAPALVEMDAYDARGARLGRVAQLMVEAGPRDIPVMASRSLGAHWLLLTIDGRRQILSTGGLATIPQPALPGALRSAATDSVEQIVYTLQGQLIATDTVKNLIQSGLEKWIQEFSVSGTVLADTGVNVDSVFAWFDGGRMTGMQRARMGYNKANLAYSGRLYTVKSFTVVHNFRVWLNVMANGNRKTGVSDTVDFSSDFGDINFIPKFSVGNALPAGDIAGPSTGLVNTEIEYSANLTKADEKIAHTEWDLDDGNGFRAGGTQQKAKWLKPGTYTVKAKLTDIDSNVTTFSKSVTIANTPTSISGLRDTTITPGDIVTFSLNLSDPDGVAKVLWDFGDGVQDSTFGGTSHQLSHNFLGADTIKVGTTRIYQVQVKVFDNLGAIASLSGMVAVTNDRPVVSVRDTTGKADELITFRATTSDRGRIVMIEWSVNGTTFIPGGKDTTLKMPSTATGDFLLYVRATDEDGNPSKVDTVKVAMENSFTDSRDGQRYKVVKIGTQTWMAQSLAFSDEGKLGLCPGGTQAGCDKYGRLYTWPEAMAIAKGFDSTVWGGRDSGVTGICPTGWHLPSIAEWKILETTVDPTTTNSGTKLMAKTGWTGAVGTDEFGFNSLPAGGYVSFTGYYAQGTANYFWSATEKDKGAVYGPYVYNGNTDLSTGSWNNKYRSTSVRCLAN